MFCYSRSERGSVLIVVLLIVALLTIMVVAFNSVALKDLNATQSYAQSVRAQEMALSGLDKIVSQIQAEITDPNNNTLNGNGTSTSYMYVPKSANMVPQRMLPTPPTPIVTISGANIYSGNADFASIGNLTTSSSLNGRNVSTARWLKPQLLLPAAASSFNVPSWVIVTRAGPQSFTGSTPTNASLNVSSLTNMSAAIGRYSYVIYDTSGLLDVNVAGYPSTAASSAAIKGCVPWADLTRLSSTITQSDVDSLVSWRNASNASAYSTYVPNTWATNGFMVVAPGDTRFLSRQDLIDYVQAQNTHFTNALPYMTTFSREVNGPTWQPTTPTGSSIDYASQCLTSGVTNPAIFNPRVQKAFTRDNGMNAIVGEPLVKYRFPLDKLALLQKQETSVLTAQDTADILKYFGLTLAADSSTFYKHWVYTSPSGTSPTGATTILTLDQVAALPTKGIAAREPDFFEMLQAGILSGSLGKYGRGENITPVHPLTTIVDNDSVTTYQIIRIGANIIDQWETDSIPTVITFNSEDFYGIDDLPYINKIFYKSIGTGPSQPRGMPGPPYSFYLYYELWNPHQPVSSYASYPSQFRIVPCPSDNFHYGIGCYWVPYANWYYNQVYGWTNPATGTTSQTFSSLPNGGAITFSASATNVANDYREPMIIPGSPPWTGGPSIAALSLGSVPSFPPVGYWDKTGSSYQWKSTYPTDPKDCVCGFQAVFQIQYLDASGAWHTYGTFNGTTDTLQTGFDVLINTTPTAPGNSADADSFPKSDPRTYRFGAGTYMPLSGPASNSTGSLVPAPPVASVTTLVSPSTGSYIPFSGNPANVSGSDTTPVDLATPYRIDLWSVNDPSVKIVGPSYNGSPAMTNNLAGTTAPFYADNDGLIRPGDSHLAYPATSPYYSQVNQARPVILHRPFQSVGDLGYAFRDMPWKTLDLSSPNSADARLLDLFTLSDTPVIAGRVNPNTAPAPVLSALLSGTLANYSGTSTSLPAATAGAIATALTTAATTTPFANRASLVSSFMSNPAITAAFPDGIKMEREAVIRALAEPANTRTWNFMIDIIAQSGNYPSSATSLDNFNVTGERRYWLHIAIDRYTGQVVDKQLEAVNE